MIRKLTTGTQTIFFVADDLGMPVSPGYPTHTMAEQVKRLIESSDGNAILPEGVDVEKLVQTF